MVAYRIGTFIICHVVYLALSHIHYKYCIGGFSWWSILTSFNSHSNGICTQIKMANEIISLAIHSTLISWITEIPRLFIRYRRVPEDS